MANDEQVERNGWDVVREIVAGASDEEFEALVSALDHDVDRQTDLRRVVRGVLPETHRGEASMFISGIIAFLAGWMAAGRPEGLDERVIARAFPNGEGEAQRTKLMRLINARALLLSAGALEAQRARGLNVMQVSLSMDLTPIAWSDDPGSALLPGFQLAIDTYGLLDISQENRQLITIDIDDVRVLKKEIDDALDRLEKLRASYAERNILIWGAQDGEENDE